MYKLLPVSVIVTSQFLPGVAMMDFRLFRTGLDCSNENLSLSLLDIRCTLHKPYLKAYKPPKSLDAKESSARPEFKSP